MWKSKYICIALFLALGNLVHAQRFEKGFEMLEKGNYAEAEAFFRPLVALYPTNKTAKLCLGRAVGLGGNPAAAVRIFEELKAQHPNDLEVLLNHAEAYLWDKRYAEAKPLYKRLVHLAPNSFPALLGYANTLSNLKEYAEALQYMNKALSITPNNPNGLLSKKYLILAYAFECKQQQQYNEALRLLDQNLRFLPNDRETLLDKAAVHLELNNLHQAKAIYQQVAVNKKDSVVVNNALALVAHRAHQNGKALRIMQQNKRLVLWLSDDSVLVDQTNERYIQALMWNGHYREAQQAINQLRPSYCSYALVASLAMYRSDYPTSIAYYNQLLALDSASFDGNLGKANALFASNQTKEAYQTIDRTLVFFPNQVDATKTLRKIDQLFTPSVEQNALYSMDNGDDWAVAAITSVRVPLSTQWAVQTRYQYRDARNSTTQQQATTHDLTLGAAYQITPQLALKANAGITRTSSYSQMLADAAVSYNALKRQYLELGYKRDVQNFNAALIEREIAANHFYLNHNISTLQGLGWFTQYDYAFQSDQNTRNLLFTSFYANVLKYPALKTGVNYQYITFKQQLPEVYFSPAQFHAVEVFVNVQDSEKPVPPKRVYYDANLATGLQFIEQEKSQFTYRMQCQLGYIFSNRLQADLYGLHSNIASVTPSANGFIYTEFGVHLKWFLTSKPVFRKKTHQPNSKKNVPIPFNTTD